MDTPKWDGSNFATNDIFYISMVTKALNTCHPMSQKIGVTPTMWIKLKWLLQNNNSMNMYLSAHTPSVSKQKLCFTKYVGLRSF
jgi:hypothetical protein